MKAAGVWDWLDDAINPIVVKELRQAVQSRFVAGVLLLFLLGQLILFGAFLVTASLEQRDAFDVRAGREVFMILQAILLGTCMLFLPLYTGIRLAAERSDVNVDLLFVTTLRPRAIVGGKLLSALVLALMIFSACTPFMTFTYLLRGIDLPSIVLVVLIEFAAVVVSVQLAIFLAAIPANRFLKAALGLVGFVGLVFGFFGVVAGTIGLIRLGAARVLGSPVAWYVAS